MIQTSNDYKQMMKKPIRNRGYVSVALGIVNQNAQGDVDSYGADEARYFSQGDVLKDSSNMISYGTLEDNFTKADGKFVFPPRNTASAQFLNNGFVSATKSEDSNFVITFNTVHDIKGLTVEFEETAYPLSLEVTTYNGQTATSYSFTPDSYKFETNTTFGEIDKIELSCDDMAGGIQAWHIKNVLMGIGMVFQNDTIESAELESFISGISAEISYKDFSLTVLDSNNAFDVDQTDSFINYLEPLQPIAISFGVDLDNGKKEWLKVADLKLKEWNSTKGKVTFVATDLLTQDENNYSHMVLTSRTAKSEFEAIFADMGLSAEDYSISNYLGTVNITNPIEENAHKHCLQLLANATRSIVYEDENGIVHVEDAFDATMLPEDTQTTLTNASYFAYTGDYLSSYPTDNAGYFNSVRAPIITKTWSELKTLSQFKCKLSAGNENAIIVSAYANGTLTFSKVYRFTGYEFEAYDYMGAVNQVTVTIEKSNPLAQIGINFSFSNISPYTLEQQDVFEVGKAKDAKVKAVKVKIYTYETVDDEIRLVDDDVWYTEMVGAEGVIKYCENPLISNSTQAQKVAKWLASYYTKTKNYDVDFRGEPSLQAHDFVGMENEYAQSLIVNVEKTKITFNGAFHGILEARQAN